MPVLISSLNIPVNDVPMEGALVRGSVEADIFELAPGDAQPLGTLSFEFRAYVFEEILRIEGSVEAQFDLECTRCLEKFPYDHLLSEYSAEIEIENRAIVDLTDRVREDMLLSLPAYPHCDASSDERECPVGDRFTAVPDDSDDQDDSGDEGKPSSSSENDVWSALDSWKQDET